MRIGKPLRIISTFIIFLLLFLSSCTTKTVVITQTIPVEITIIVTSPPKPTNTPKPTSPSINDYRSDPSPTSIPFPMDHYAPDPPEPYTLVEIEGTNNWISEIYTWIACENAVFMWTMNGSSLMLRITDIGNNNTQVLQYIDISPPDGGFIIAIEESKYQIEIFTNGDWVLEASCEPYLY